METQNGQREHHQIRSDQIILIFSIIDRLETDTTVHYDFLVFSSSNRLWSAPRHFFDDVCLIFVHRNQRLYSAGADDVGDLLARPCSDVGYRPCLCGTHM
jgi:hypothetical protein